MLLLSILIPCACSMQQNINQIIESNDNLSLLEETLGMNKSFSELYELISNKNTTMEHRNDYIRQFCCGLFHKPWNLRAILFIDCNVNTLRTIDRTLNIPTVLQHPAMFENKNWMEFYADVNEIKQQFISGLNYSIKFSDAKYDAAKKFCDSYFKYLTDYTNVERYKTANNNWKQKVIPSSKIAYESYLNFSNTMFQKHKITNEQNTLCVSILKKLLQNILENTPENIIRKSKDDWASIFEQAWKEQYKEHIKGDI